MANASQEPPDARPELRVLIDGLDHAEAVAWSPARHSLFAGSEAGRIYEVTLDGGARQVAETGGFILGLAVDAHGKLYACDRGRREVLRIDPDTGAVAVLSSGVKGVRMKEPNWPTFDRDGSLFVSDSGTWRGNDGLIYRIDPRGETTVWCDSVRHYPNGSCLDVDDRALIVVESALPGITRIPINPDGSAGSPEVLVRLPGSVPDGIILTTAGDFLVTCYRPDRIYRLRRGRTDIFLDDPDGELLNQPTNAVFAGEERDRLVIANLGGWHLTICEPGLRGVGAHYPELS